jgi:hypothetical protein
MGIPRGCLTVLVRLHKVRHCHVNKIELVQQHLQANQIIYGNPERVYLVHKEKHCHVNKIERVQQHDSCRSNHIKMGIPRGCFTALVHKVKNRYVNSCQNISRATFFCRPSFDLNELYSIHCVQLI